MTGRENLKMVARLFGHDRRSAKAAAAKVLDQLGLSDAADRLVRTYSGGMRRRLDLGASMVGAPKLLLLDEPSTGLDPRSRIELWDAITAMVANGTDVLLTTQYLEEADRLASTIAVVDRGTVIATGSPAELKASIGSTVLTLTFASQAATTRAVRALAKAAGTVPKVDGTTVELTLKEGAKQVIQLLRALDAAKATPVTLALREPSLDDVFLALTGRRAEEEEAAAAAAPPDRRSRRASRGAA